ncbi:MAG: metal-dependent hydrolase [Bryobacteraceae bacterium]
MHRFTPHAAWLLILANAPDCDAVSGFFGAESYFRYHRWFTHSIAFVPLVALLPVLLVALIFRSRLPWLRAWLVSMVGVCSHLLLDLTNPYGIRLYFPFSSQWPSLDITNIIDVWIWLALGVAIAAPAISRLVASEIGGAKTSGRGWAVFALIFLPGYNGVRLALHDRAVAVQEARLYEGQSPTRVEVVPTPVNPLLWRGFVETNQLWAIHEVDLSKDFDPASGSILYRTQAPVIELNVRNSSIYSADLAKLVIGKFRRHQNSRVTKTWSCRICVLVSL